MTADRPVVLTQTARQDLADIWTEACKGSEAGANRLIARLLRRCDGLGRWPYSGRAMPDLGPGVRGDPAFKRMILYRVLPDSIQVLHIFHGARDLPTAMRRAR